MSNNATDSQAAATGRKMKPATGMEGAKIRFIRPSKLEGPQTLVTEALYLGSTANNFDDGKSDYKFEEADGGIAVVNGAGNLGYQMSSVAVNSIVTVEYKGKQEIKKGKLKGKLSHNFQVLVAAE